MTNFIIFLIFISFTISLIEKFTKENKKNTRRKRSKRKINAKIDNEINFYKSLHKNDTVEKKKRYDGLAYEKFVSNYYRSLNYQVIENGRIKGRKDGGIDIIAIKEDELLLIQCKHWNSENKRRIKHNNIKEFIGNVQTFLENNMEYSHYKLQKIYITSEEILDKSAINFINSNPNSVKHKIIRFNNGEM